MNTPPPGQALVNVSGATDVTFEGIQFENAPTAIRAENSEVTTKDVGIDNVGTGMHFGDGSAGTVLNSTVNAAREAGIRVEDSSLYSEGLTVENSNVGLDIGPKSRGGVRASRLIENDIDIRYHKDSIVHIFDTTARYILDRTNGTGIQSLNNEWICHRIIWTTDLGEMARGIKKLIRSRAIGKAGAQLSSLAVQLAGAILRR